MRKTRRDETRRGEIKINRVYKLSHMLMINEEAMCMKKGILAGASDPLRQSRDGLVDVIDSSVSLIP